MRTFFACIGLAAGLVASACASGDDGGESGNSAVTAAQIGSAFDVSDVSILFPLKKNADGNVPYPQIRVSGVAPAGGDVAPAASQLWTNEVWTAVIAEAQRQGIKSGETGNSDFFKLRGLWHIVGLRFDPCAPGFADNAIAAAGGKCIVQIRLIAQPFVPNATGASDFSAHLVYNLAAVDKASLATNPTVQAAAKMLGDIKDASAKLGHGARTDGQPLGVHAGLDAEAISNSGTQVADLVKNLIKTFAAGPSRKIAFMGLRNGGPEPWTFFVGDVTNNAFKLVNGPAHGQPSQTLSFVASDGPVLQKSSNPVNTSALFTVDAAKLTPAQRQLAFKVENPDQQNVLGTDCISCHTSSARTNELSLGDKDEISARRAVPANITGYVQKAQAQDDAWNVRNFGYFFAKPTVSGRTVAETVDVVQWFNKNVRAPGSGLNGPGRDCSGMDAQIFKCFRDGQLNCQEKCKPAPQPTPDVAERTPVPMTIDPAKTDDPCLNATVGGAGTVNTEHSGDQILITLGGNNSACLTRVMGGAFVSKNLSVICTSPAQCIVTIIDSPGSGNDTAQVTGDEEKRFRQFFRVRDGEFFQTREGGETGLNGEVAGLQIGCDVQTCTATVAADKTTLPTIGAGRINPE